MFETIETISAYFCCVMFYVITPTVFVFSLIMLWIEDR